LEFEPDILRKEFYTYIKTFELTKQKVTADTSILSLKRTIEKELDSLDIRPGDNKTRGMTS
jgi:hypothetical protein